MLYQPLLVGKDSYFLQTGSAATFELHRHPEMELSFCLSGGYSVIIDGETYHLQAGDLALIPPMAAHEFLSGEGRRMTVELGPGFLGEYFRPLVNMTFSRRIFRLTEGDEVFFALNDLLRETGSLWETRSEFSGLAIRGNLFRISALILQHFLTIPGGSSSARSLRDVARIELALEMIHERYASPLDLDCVCEACGFSKSSFCRIFKKITGNTFHNVLNRHRVEVACLHLRDSSLPVAEISVAVGFADAKSFCRVFRSITGESPGVYRRRHS